MAYDLVISNLVLHYNADLDKIYRNVFRTLKPIGCFLLFFLGQSVEKQHRTLTQILNTLIGTGFQIASVEEAMPPQEMMNIPGMTDEMRRPMMLLVKAVKP